MTWYIVLQQFPEPKGWYPITDPDWYLSAKRTMRDLKRSNPNEKYRLIKTSY
jgi:hypothetical protein